MTTQTVDSIIASFPNTTISSSDEEPTYNLIKIAEKELIENATSIRSELGGGQHGCLNLILATTKHASITSSNFISHANPESFSTFPPLQKQPQLSQINYTHKIQLRLWREQCIVTRAITNNLTNDFDDSCMSELHNIWTG